MPAPASCSSDEGKRPPPSRAPKAAADDDDSSYEDAFDASLFLNEEYVTVSVPFGDVEEEQEDREAGEEEEQQQQQGGGAKRAGRFSLDLLVSEAASTDFDLTGQVLWPAAALLAGFLVAGEDGDGDGRGGEGGAGAGKRKSRGRAHAARARSACELGAGLGLSGLAAVAFSGLRRLVLTEGSDVVLRVLERNAQKVAKSFMGEEEEKRDVSVSLLEWGDEAAAAALVKERSPGGRGFDLLLGADVTYSLSALPALFSTAAALLRREEEDDEEEEKKEEKEEEEEEKPVPTFLLGYVSRSGALDAAVPREAEKAGFDVEVVEGTRRRLPGGQEGWIHVMTKKKWKDEK